MWLHLKMLIKFPVFLFTPLICQRSKWHPGFIEPPSFQAYSRQSSQGPLFGKPPFKQNTAQTKRTPSAGPPTHPVIICRTQGLCHCGWGSCCRKRFPPCWRPHQGNGAKIAETAHGIKTSLAELRQVPIHSVSHKKPFWNCQSYLSNPC